MLVWEEIPHDRAGSLHRTKVPNGWLVREVQEVHVNVPDQFILESVGYEWTSSLTFIPDINHEWVIT